MKKPFTMRLEPELKEKLRKIAAENHRSMAEQVEYWIDNAPVSSFTGLTHNRSYLGITQCSAADKPRDQRRKGEGQK